MRRGGVMELALRWDQQAEDLRTAAFQLRAVDIDAATELVEVIHHSGSDTMRGPGATHHRDDVVAQSQLLGEVRARLVVIADGWVHEAEQLAAQAAARRHQLMLEQLQGGRQ